MTSTPSRSPEPSTDARGSAQTLSRGIRILEVLAEADRPLSAQELAATLGVSRPIVYRLLRTLDEHGLLERDLPPGRYGLGLGLLTLARRVNKNLREAATPVLRELATRTSATAFLGLLEGEDIVCLVSAESPDALVAIRYREGLRIPANRGASGLAIGSLLPATNNDRPELIRARENGYASSQEDLEPNASAISAPIRGCTMSARACVTIIFPFPKLPDITEYVPALLAAADRIGAATTL